MLPLHSNHRAPAYTAGPRPSPFGVLERRIIFKDMVLGELRRGRLDRRRRKRLVEYAAILQIRASDAGRLMTDAVEEFEARLALDAEAGDVVPGSIATGPSHWALWVGGALLAAGAAVPLLADRLF